MGKNRMGAGAEPHVWELLSAYIDNELDKAEHDEVRAHLQECGDCRAAYIELRATRYMLRTLPVMPPPRAFTLTPADVAPKPGFWERLLAPRNAPRFATGSVLAFALLLFVFISNTFVARMEGSVAATSDVRVGSGLSAEAPTAAPAANSYSAAAAPTETPAAAAAPPQAPAAGGAAPAGGSAAAQPTPQVKIDQANGLPAPEATPASGAENSDTGAAAEATDTPPAILHLETNPAQPTPTPTAQAALGAGQTTGPATTGSQGNGDQALKQPSGYPGTTAGGAVAQNYTPVRPSAPFPTLLAIELLLALLGVLMAGAAVLSRRR